MLSVSRLNAAYGRAHVLFDLALQASKGEVVVLLGGIQTLTGALWGAALFTWLQDSVARAIDYWRAVIGIVILVLVLAFPQGLTGFIAERLEKRSE